MSRDNQISEMVKIMNECCNRYDEQGNHIGNKCYECEEWSDDNHCCCSYNTKEATALYNAGYRKYSDVVKLEEKLADVTANWQKLHDAYDADCIEHYNKGRFEVAREIFEEIKSVWKEGHGFIDCEDLFKLKKKYTESEKDDG